MNDFSNNKSMALSEQAFDDAAIALRESEKKTAVMLPITPDILLVDTDILTCVYSKDGGKLLAVERDGVVIWSAHASAEPAPPGFTDSTKWVLPETEKGGGE